MKTTVVIFLLAFSTLAWANRKHSATMVPAEMSATPTTTAPNTTTTSTPTTTAPNTTTTSTPTTTAPNTTTTSTPTTTAPNTTTTSTTTTTAPNTTTTSTTTTTAPNTTTTAPTTTPTAPPTTKPPTKDNSTVGNYTLDNGDHRCLMVQMALKIRLVSQSANGMFLLLPNETSVGGGCIDNNANLTLIFPQGNITFMFFKNVTQDSTFVNRLIINLKYNFSKKSNAAADYHVDNQSIHLFNAQIGKSYSCRKESLDLSNGLFLDIDSTRMQAFNFTSSNEFGPTDPCPADRNNYRVAIAVGITLLVLIVVVVIAYLLARRKRTDGYQSL